MTLIGLRAEVRSLLEYQQLRVLFLSSLLSNLLAAWLDRSRLVRLWLMRGNVVKLCLLVLPLSRHEVPVFTEFLLNQQMLNIDVNYNDRRRVFTN